MHCRLGLEEDNGARHTARASEGNTRKRSTPCMKYAMVQDVSNLGEQHTARLYQFDSVGICK